MLGGERKTGLCGFGLFDFGTTHKWTVGVPRCGALSLLQKPLHYRGGESKELVLNPLRGLFNKTPTENSGRFNTTEYLDD